MIKIDAALIDIEDKAQVIVSLFNAGFGPEEAWSRVAPDADREEILLIHQRVEEIFEENAAAIEVERHLIAVVEELCGPLWQLHPNWTVGQCLDHLIARGDERAADIKARWEQLPPIEHTGIDPT
jgi:hypothetical protein